MLTFYHVFRAGSIFLQVLDAAILLYVIMSWFRPQIRFFYMLENFVRPFIMPFRRLSVWLMSKTRMPLDFSCWFALIGISILERLWQRLYFLVSTLIR